MIYEWFLGCCICANGTMSLNRLTFDRTLFGRGADFGSFLTFNWFGTIDLVPLDQISRLACYCIKQYCRYRTQLFIYKRIVRIFVTNSKVIIYIPTVTFAIYQNVSSTLISIYAPLIQWYQIDRILLNPMGFDRASNNQAT